MIITESNEQLEGAIKEEKCINKRKITINL